MSRRYYLDDYEDDYGKKKAQPKKWPARLGFILFGVCIPILAIMGLSMLGFLSMTWQHTQAPIVTVGSAQVQCNGKLENTGSDQLCSTPIPPTATQLLPTPILMPTPTPAPVALKLYTNDQQTCLYIGGYWGTSSDFVYACDTSVPIPMKIGALLPKSGNPLTESTCLKLNGRVTQGDRFKFCESKQ